MSPRHVVVDGSNIATEGRSLPSLQQLDDAVREFLIENPDDVVTVVVDASFGHRIDSAEQRAFDEAESAGEIVSPPAGAIGRGDAFLLRIADKTGATVLSNDSFQEFHGEYDWLFEKGRLIGGKPVPAVGWIFTPRSPVRGPKSREAVKEAKRKKPAGSLSSDGTGDSAEPEEAPVVPAKNKGRGRKSVERAIATATEEAVTPEDKGKRRRRRKGGTPPAEPVNEPMVFLQFVADHKLGDTVEAEVDSFSSHGAFVTVGLTRCYVPLQAMGDPPPRSAREVMARHDRISFVVQAFDPPRRGVELALPAFARVAGAPTDETVEAEISAATAGQVEAEPAAKPASRRGRPRGDKAAEPVDRRQPAPAEEAPVKAEPEPSLSTASGFRRNTRTTLPPAAERPERTASPSRGRPAKKQAGPARKAAPSKKEARAKPAKKKAVEAAKPVKKKAAAVAQGTAKPAGAAKKAGRSAKPGAVKKATVRKATVKKTAIKEASATAKPATRGTKKATARR